MANDNLASKTSPQIVTLINNFVTTDSDGSLRLNDIAMVTWLSEQFNYYTNSATAQTIKDSNAQSIVNELKKAINRENWASNPNWPKTGTNLNETARTRMKAIQDQLKDEVAKIEAPYKDLDTGYVAKVKSLFNNAVVPDYPSGTAQEIQGRSYCVTFVTDRGEESKPSPVTDVFETDQNDTVTVNRPTVPSGRNITKWRLYRTAVGSQSAAYMFHSEHDIATTSVLDDKPAEQLGETCQTFGWDEPLPSLKGLIGMPNGILLGFTDDTLHACEPYAPYAWPAKYDIPLEFPIVGMVAFGQSAFVGTEGCPYVVTGADSQSLAAQKIESNQACVSRRSMVALGGAVVYASPDGLCVYENGGISVATQSVFSKEDWQAYNPSSMQGAEYEGRYYCAYTKTDTTRGMFMFDYSSGHISMLDATVDALFSDRVTDTLYALNGTDIINLAPTTGTKLNGKYKSKIFRMVRPTSFGWIHVDAAYPGEVTVKAYGDGTLVHTATLTMDKPARFPAGKYREWQFEITSNITVNSVTLCSAIAELSNV